MTHIFLYGPPGTGKSTVGKILARNLELAFVDLDRVIETNAGMSIAQIMEQRGESAFRELESSALQAISDEKESVIALGGGALLNVANHEFAQEVGKVVLLMAELDNLFERLNESPNNRPLLAGDLRTQLSS
ncbi:MAG: shikimate kinase, partial [Chloroflexota bacterium]|nr:shikimate kinase [Chloroflexota bacterium]